MATTIVPTNVIAFPGANVYPSDFESIPAGWSETDEYTYDTYRRHGLAAREAVEKVERQRAIHSMQKLPGECDRDLLLRQAQAAFSGMKRKGAQA